jgi:hypothetical protein
MDRHISNKEIRKKAYCKNLQNKTLVIAAYIKNKPVNANKNPKKLKVNFMEMTPQLAD